MTCANALFLLAFHENDFNAQVNGETETSASFMGMLSAEFY
jgi:hypothetical protein